MNDDKKGQIEGLEGFSTEALKDRLGELRRYL